MPTPSLPDVVKVFEAGAVVFREGEAGDTAYFVEHGVLEVVRSTSAGTVERVNVLRAGAMVGEFALLDGRPRSATVRVLSTARLLPLHRGHLQGLLAQADPVIRSLVMGLVERLRRPLIMPTSAIEDAADGSPANGGDARVESLTQGPTQAEHGGAAGPGVKPAASPWDSLLLARELADAIEAARTLHADDCAPAGRPVHVDAPLQLHYQPILHLPTGRLAGFEALVRWRHPTRGMVRPDEFIALAERTDLIHGIGEFVLHRALSDWLTLGPLCDLGPAQRGFISVNLSAPELTREGVVQRVGEALRRHAVPAPELRLELTETVALDSPRGAVEAAQALRDLGVGIALDDFGKGFAGLDVLQSLPFSCLKVDKAFIDRMLSSRRSFQIVRATLDLARRLDMTTVCEGIEDAHTAETLADLGCDYAQGYHFGRPMPLAAVAAWKMHAAV